MKTMLIMVLITVGMVCGTSIYMKDWLGAKVTVEITAIEEAIAEAEGRTMVTSVCRDMDGNAEEIANYHPTLIGFTESDKAEYYRMAGLDDCTKERYVDVLFVKY